MSIVAKEDSRNVAWASDKSAFGHRMLEKMGWSKGKGLGKNQQGNALHLRAIRREDGLGIGATTDTFGDGGWTTTTQNFHAVLANLKAEHGDAGAPSIHGKKEKRKSKKRKDKNSAKVKGGSSGKEENEKGLTLAQNRVAAGHAKKMREAKDLAKKSKEDMAAIFGMKVEAYQASSVWGKLQNIGNSEEEEKKDDMGERNFTSTNKSKGSLDKGDSSTELSDSNDKKQKKKKDKKKRKRKEIEKDASSSNDDSNNREKKKKKSKKSKKEK